MKNTMHRVPVLTALVACGALLMPVGMAEAAKKSTKPEIKRVTPMRVSVGKTLTIRGSNFSTSKKRNTVLFVVGKRQAFAKPSRVSRKKLVVKVPPAAENLLTGTAKRRATRLQLRVVTKRYGKLTTLRLSPIVLSSRGVVAACAGTDADNDLLPKDVELKYALDPCKKDTDGDGAEDGWEYWAAKDLNTKAYPYPGKKPYPNPLQAGDTGYDFDGDSLNAGTEFQLWVADGRSFEPARANNGRRDSPLGYSDGTQASRPEATPSVPDFKLFTQLKAAYPEIYEMRNDGIWGDDERDADRDGLNNHVEVSGPGKQSWWTKYLAKYEQDVTPWPGPGARDKNHGVFTLRPFSDVEANDPDGDGDTLLDAEDDQDADDVLNFWEMYNPLTPDVNTGYRKNPFNPCAPASDSRTCPPYEPL